MGQLILHIKWSPRKVHAIILLWKFVVIYISIIPFGSPPFRRASSIDWVHMVSSLRTALAFMFQQRTWQWYNWDSNNSNRIIYLCWFNVIQIEFLDPNAHQLLLDLEMVVNAHDLCEEGFSIDHNQWISESFLCWHDVK
jgi:hypothetical protein